MLDNEGHGALLKADATPGLQLERLAGGYQLLLFAVVFAISLEVGHLASFKGEPFATFWPANGVYAGVFLCQRMLRRWLPVAGLGLVINALSNYFVHHMAGTLACGFAVANLAGALLSAWVYRQLRPLDRLAAVGFPLFAFFLSSMVGPSLGATLAASLVYKIDHTASFAAAWRLWWASDAIGYLVSLPPFLIWWHERQTVGADSAPPRRSPAEWLVVVVLTVGLTFFALADTGQPRLVVQNSSVLFPLLVLVAARLGLRGVATSFSLLACVAVWLVATDNSAFFRRGGAISDLLALQVYLANLAVTSFVVAAIFDGRHRHAMQLRHLTATLDSAREDERKRIAFEVHDNVGQTLAVLKMHIPGMRRTASAEQSTTLDAIADLASKALDELRTLSRDLRPTALENISFQAAARDLIARLQKSSGLSFHVALDEQLRLSNPVRLCFYRVLQEALTNILKHSQTKSVDVRLSTDGRSGDVVLLVKDYGQGIDLVRHATGSGLGLISMRERAEAVGAALTFRSEAGAGASVEVRLPSRLNEANVP